MQKASVFVGDILYWTNCMVGTDLDNLFNIIRCKVSPNKRRGDSIFLGSLFHTSSSLIYTRLFTLNELLSDSSELICVC